MAKRLLLFIIAGLLLGCSDKIKIYTYPLSNPDPTPSTTPDTVTLTLDREYPLPGAEVNDVVLFRVRDTMLFYSENRDGVNRFNIYDIKNGRTMQSLVLADDKYDKEALARSIIADVESDTVMLHHQVISGRLLRFAIDDLVRGELKPSVSKYIVDSYIMSRYYKDGYYIAKTFKHNNVTNRVVNPDNGYERLYRYIPDNAKIKHLNTDLSGKLVTEENPSLFANTGVQVVSQKRGAYVFASYSINHLIFFNIDNDFILRPIREINDRQYAPWFRAGREDKTEFATNYHFYAQVQPSDNFVYLLFYGFRKDDEEKHSAIVKYDWSGDLKTVYHITEGLCYSFAVTEDDKRMFLEVEKGDKVNIFETNL
ncbi:MAG: hypothetical protein K2L01_02750 [Rikenellaceae bacterium]|nr:hypothetical protein [Rikenellaceae bacterium]